MVHGCQHIAATKLLCLQDASLGLVKEMQALQGCVSICMNTCVCLSICLAFYPYAERILCMYATTICN
jgi:hypothetical protein